MRFLLICMTVSSRKNYAIAPVFMGVFNLKFGNMPIH
jgi:hypothetical protein